MLTAAYLDVARNQHFVRPQQKILDEIPDLPDELIPKALLGWKTKIIEFLKRHPFDRNVFVMTRYAEPSASLLKIITESIGAVGDVDGKTFFPVVAKEQSITDDLYNPIACLLCCRYGVAVFDTVEKQPIFNPNVAYELGAMHLLQRKCLILKSHAIKVMPSDILQKIYEPFSSAKEAGQKTDAWLRALTI